MSEFGKQVSERVYESMIFEIANEANERQDKMYEKIGQGKNDRNSNDVLTGK